MVRGLGGRGAIPGRLARRGGVEAGRVRRAGSEVSPPGLGRGGRTARLWRCDRQIASDCGGVRREGIDVAAWRRARDAWAITHPTPRGSDGTRRRNRFLSPTFCSFPLILIYWHETCI